MVPEHTFAWVCPPLTSPLCAKYPQRINDIWLKDSDYVAGNDISIADLQLAAEIDMSELLSATSKARGRVMRVGPWVDCYYGIAVQVCCTFSHAHPARRNAGP